MQPKNNTARKPSSRLQQIRDEQDAKHTAAVLRAISELLHNPLTPQNLFEAVAEFVCEQSNVGSENIFHSTPVLNEVLKSVPQEELRWSVIAARKEER